MGPFGHFLDIKAPKLPIQMLSHLALRQCETERNDILAFNLKGNCVEFGLKEFCMLTGLKCEELPIQEIDEDVECEIRRTFFKNVDSIDRNRLVDSFNVLSQVNIPNPNLKVKFANLYLLECLLLPKQPHNKINPYHLKMVDDEEKFRSFPWGRECFDLTIQYFRKSTRTNSSYLSLQGFSYIFIFWALEIIPILADIVIAKRIEKSGPRITNWEINYSEDWQSLKENVFDSSKFSVQEMIPSEEDFHFETILRFIEEDKKEKEVILEKEAKDKEENEERRKRKMKVNDGDAFNEKTTSIWEAIEKLRKNQEENVEALRKDMEELKAGQEKFLKTLNLLVEENIAKSSQEQQSHIKNVPSTISLERIDTMIDVDRIVDFATNYATKKNREDIEVGGADGIQREEASKKNEEDIEVGGADEDEDQREEASKEKEKDDKAEEEDQEKDEEKEAEQKEAEQREDEEKEDEEREEFQRENRTKKINGKKGKGKKEAVQKYKPKVADGRIKRQTRPTKKTLKNASTERMTKIQKENKKEKGKREAIQAIDYLEKNSPTKKSQELSPKSPTVRHSPRSCGSSIF